MTIHEYGTDQENFPHVEFVELKDMGHVSMASLHPKEMAERFERLYQRNR